MTASRAPSSASAQPPQRRRRGDGKADGRVLLITGMSGAGKTSALKALEDLGYEAIDNVPLALLRHLVLPHKDHPAALERSMAIGIDVRTRDFGVEPFLREVDRLVSEPDADVTLLFLDCDDETLRQRYTETRHRHPLAIDRPVSDGIAQERRTIFALRGRADVCIDTTHLGPGELKRILEGSFGLDAGTGLNIFVTSFSFRLGLPREADLVLDVRFLANPHYDPELRTMTGLDRPVAAFVADDPDFPAFFDNLTGWLGPLLPRYADEGKSYLTIAVGCTGGRHRSVFVAERMAEWLHSQQLRVRVHHRDLHRSA